MAFHFALDTVLRYRRSLEERERIHLQVLLAKRAAGLQEIEALRAARLRLNGELQHSLEQARIPAAELQLSVVRRNNIGQAVARVQFQLQELQTVIARQTERYRTERERSEVLHSLRDIQQREYQLIQRRREQAMLDELHLLRRRRNQS